MRQSEAKDLRSFLEEPVEEIVVDRLGIHSTVGASFTTPTVGAPFMAPTVGAAFTTPTVASPLSEPLQEVGVKFISAWEGMDAHLQGTGVQFTAPWEGTGGQLHEVGARFTRPLGTNRMDTPPLGSPLLGTNPAEVISAGTMSRITDDFTLQQTMPMVPVLPALTTSLRPHRLQRYQSRGVPVSISRSVSGTLKMRSTDDTEWRDTAYLAPASQKLIQGEPSPALKSWERRQHDIYAWLVLLLLFLLVVLGGIGLDSLIASYH